MRSNVRVACAALALAGACCALAPSLAPARKPARGTAKPAPSHVPPADSTTVKKAPAPVGGGAARPALPPGMTPGRTTIAPFPVPGDTGRDAAAKRKLLNVPRPGVNALIPTPPPQAPTTPDTGALPKLGDYVYVTELPEAITQVPPSYPEAARRAGVDGTVMVQALVLRDGSVGDVHIVKSIPPLDAAAAEAVRQWRFRPAKGSEGQPIAVWVGVPVKFTLH